MKLYPFRFVNSIRQVDAHLLRWSVYSRLYPDPAGRPQTRLALLLTLIALELTLVASMLRHTLLLVLALPLWLSTLAEWRLWFCLKDRPHTRATHPLLPEKRE